MGRHGNSPRPSIERQRYRLKSVYRSGFFINLGALILAGSFFPSVSPDYPQSPVYPLWFPLILPRFPLGSLSPLLVSQLLFRDPFQSSLGGISQLGEWSTRTHRCRKKKLAQPSRYIRRDRCRSFLRRLRYWSNRSYGRVTARRGASSTSHPSWYQRGSYGGPDKPARQERRRQWWNRHTFMLPCLATVSGVVRYRSVKLKFIKLYSKARRKAPAYSRARHCIRRAIEGHSRISSSDEAHPISQLALQDQ